MSNKPLCRCAFRIGDECDHPKCLERNPTNNEQKGAIPAEFMEWIEQTRPKDTDRDFTPAEVGHQHGYVAGAKAAYRQLTQSKASVLTDYTRQQQEWDTVLDENRLLLQRLKEWEDRCATLEDELAAITPVLRWVKASERLPNDGMEKAARFTYSDGSTAYSYLSAGDGKISLGNKEPIPIMAASYLLEDWEWLEEITAPEAEVNQSGFYCIKPSDIPCHKQCVTCMAFDKGRQVEVSDANIGEIHSEQYKSVWDAWEGFEEWNKSTHGGPVPESAPYAPGNIRKNYSVILKASAERGAKWMRDALEKRLQRQQSQLNAQQKEINNLKAMVVDRDLEIRDYRKAIKDAKLMIATQHALSARRILADILDKYTSPNNTQPS